MNNNYNNDLLLLCDQNEQAIKEAIIWFSIQPVSLMINLNKTKQKIFKTLQDKNKDKALLDFSALIIAINNYKSTRDIVPPGFDFENISYKIKRKKKAKKFEKLNLHRNKIINLRKLYSLRELSKKIEEKMKIEVSHTYINAFLTAIKKGEI